MRVKEREQQTNIRVIFKPGKINKKINNKPIDDLYIGGFPGGGAPVGLRVGW